MSGASGEGNSRFGIGRRIPRQPAIVFGLALLFRALFLLEVQLDPLFSILAVDASSYHELAQRFAAGDVLFAPEPLWFAPLYPAILGTLYAIFGPEPLAARLIQLLLGAGTAALGAALGNRVSRPTGWIAGILLAVSPVLVFYENQLLYTSLAVFGTAVFLSVFLRARETAAVAAAVGAGLLLGALGLLRSNALLFLPFGFAVLARGVGLRRAVWFGAATLAVLAPVLLRNGLVAGTWTPLTVNGGMIFATGFAEGSLGGRALLRRPTDFGPGGAYHREAEALAGRNLDLGEASRLHRDLALARIRNRPGWALALTGRKIALLLNSEEIDDNLGFPMLRGRARTLAWWPRPWAVLVMGGALGALATLRGLDRPPGGKDRAKSGAKGRARQRSEAKRRRRKPKAGVLRRDVLATLLLFGLAYGLSLLPFFVNARYRLPLVVPGAVLVGAGLHFAYRALRDGNRRAIAAAVLAVGLAGGATLRGPGVRGAPALEWVAVAAGLEQQGRHEEALGAVDHAIGLDPTVPGAHQNRALTLYSLGRLDEALPSAREATRLDPALFEAWMTEGAILASLGRLDEAVEAFRRAVDLRPDDLDARRNLTQALGLVQRRDRTGGGGPPPTPEREPEESRGR